jgi:hypothetical protein
MEKELLKDPGPWLCFYCGECSVGAPVIPAAGDLRRNSKKRFCGARVEFRGKGIMA